MKRTLCFRIATSALSLLACTSSASATLLIDTFAETLVAQDTLDDGLSVTSNGAFGSVFGGQRRLVVNKVGPPGSPIASESLFTNGFGEGQLTFDQFGTATGTFGTAHLIYDGDPLGSGTTVDPTNFADTDLTINAHSIILRNLAVVGNGIDLTIDVYDGATISTFTTELANNPTPTDFFISFDSFSDPSVFSSVNAIALTFDGLETSGSISGRGSDLSFSSLSAGVPEPSSLAMLGIACMGLCFRRRRGVAGV